MPSDYRYRRIINSQYTKVMTRHAWYDRQQLRLKTPNNNMSSAYNYIVNNMDDIDGLIELVVKRRNLYYARTFIPVLKRNLVILEKAIDDYTYNKSDDDTPLWMEIIDFNEYASGTRYVRKYTKQHKYNYVEVKFKSMNMYRYDEFYVVRTYTDSDFCRRFGL